MSNLKSFLIMGLDVFCSLHIELNNSLVSVEISCGLEIQDSLSLYGKVLSTGVSLRL